MMKNRLLQGEKVKRNKKKIFSLHWPCQNILVAKCVPYTDMMKRLPILPMTIQHDVLPICTW